MRRTAPSLLAIAAAIAGFIALTLAIRTGATTNIDKALLLAFRLPGDLAVPIGPSWLQVSARDITALGGFTLTVLITVIATAWLLIRHRRREAMILAGAVILAQAMSEWIKAAVDRPRPDIVPHLDIFYGASFPSGHATLTPALYLTLAAVLTTGKAPIAGAVLLSLAVGISRLYLGVHWPSDVLAGWLLGGAIAMAAWLALRRSGLAAGMPRERRE